MNIEIIAIGNEVLSGFTLNSNAAFLSRALWLEGLRVQRHTALSDDVAALRQGLQEALERSQLVISTGGLGPTCDDRTRSVAAELFDSDFHLDEKVAADLRKRYGEIPTLTDQATVPSKAQVLLNPAGTAPGFIFTRGDQTLILLPGVPPEMKVIFTEQVLPYVRTHFQKVVRSYAEELQMYGVPEFVVDQELRLIEKQYPEVACGIYPALGVLRVQLSVTADNANDAHKKIEAPLSLLKERFGSLLFEAPTGDIAEVVHHRFLESGKTLSAAESCTGGAFASRLTHFSGASRYFLGSIVAYSNDLKIGLLGVSDATIKKYGAVSGETVEAMLQGILKCTSSDYAVAVSGIAGPTGGTPEKPVGTVWCGMCERDGTPDVWKIKVRGTREMVIDWSVNALLIKLLETMNKF